MTPLLNRTTLKINCKEDIVFVYPLGSDEAAVQDTVLEGTVTLHLAKASTSVRDVSIRLRASATVLSCGRESTGVLIDIYETLFVGEASSELPAGDTSFPFAFRLPATAPRTQGPDENGFVEYQLEAKATGAGLLGRDLVVEQSIGIVSLQSPRGEPPPSLNSTMNNYAAGLGPVSISLSTPSLIVSGIISLNISISEAATSVVIHDAKVLISQVCLVRHFDAAGNLEDKATSKPAQIVEVQRLDGLDHPPLTCYPRPSNGLLASLEAGDPFCVQQFVRLPQGPFFCNKRTNEIIVRPSVVDNTISPFRFTTDLIILMTYTSEGPTRQMKFTESLELANCLMIADLLAPPSYKPINNQPAVQKPNMTGSHKWGCIESERCACTMTTE